MKHAGGAIRPDLLRARGAILHALRDWFHHNGYIEVHTPVMVGCPALEEHLEPIKVGQQFLHTSPEFAMKRVLASGLSRIYQITPCFRDEESGRHHSKEFTMLEWYRAGAGTAELMDEVESLIGAAATAVQVSPPQFERRQVTTLMEDAGHKDNLDQEAWFRCWIDKVEPHLTAPTIVHGYPIWQAAMATVRGAISDRFEVYLGGLELANAFAEEIDPQTLRQRFIQSAKIREAAGRQAHPIDEILLNVTPSMPRTAGIAVGIDRLVMALTGAAEIAEVQVRDKG
jgi:lysyl-tRNA synthetase class 2